MYILKYYDLILLSLVFNFVLLGDSTDDDDASDNCEFFDAQGGDSFDTSTNTYLVNCQSPNNNQHKSLSSTQVLFIFYIFLMRIINYKKKTKFRI